MAFFVLLLIWLVHGLQMLVVETQKLLVTFWPARYCARTYETEVVRSVDSGNNLMAVRVPDSTA